MTKIPLILCTLFAFAIPITGCVAPQVAVQQEILPEEKGISISK